MATPTYLRDNHPSTVVVDYTNTGNTDMVAPLLQVSADKAIMSLPNGTQFSGGTAQILAIGTDGPAGILHPGETGEIVLLAQGTSQIRHDKVDFQLGVADTTDTSAIDWASLKDQLRPSYIAQDAWNAIWNNVMASLGTTTAQYQSVLAADASALGLFGEATADPSQLLAIRDRAGQCLDGRHEPEPNRRHRPPYTRVSAGLRPYVSSADLRSISCGPARTRLG